MLQGATVLDWSQLPKNVRVRNHTNECYDWGTFGWLLRSGEVAVEKYKYFILLNSSVRGPYLPPYVPVGCALRSSLHHYLSLHNATVLQARMDLMQPATLSGLPYSLLVWTLLRVLYLGYGSPWQCCVTRKRVMTNSPTIRMHHAFDQITRRLHHHIPMALHLSHVGALGMVLSPDKIKFAIQLQRPVPVACAAIQTGAIVCISVHHDLPSHEPTELGSHCMSLSTT